MNKFIKLVLLAICFSASASPTSSQVQFYDSVKTVAASPIYDYKNPVFSNKFGYFNEYSWLVYERHSGNSSDIIVRKARYSSYDPEIVISVTTNALNINPSIDRDMIVWQSNVNGSWDLYYSLLTGNSWSAPALLDAASSDESVPFVKNNNLGPEQYNFYYLAYKRDNSIRFKRYKTLTGIWDNDTAVTDGSYNIVSPLIMNGNSSTQYVIYFLKKYSGETTKLNQRIFYEDYTGPPVAWENVFEVYQPNSQYNLSLSFANSDYLTYSYDTLNSKHILISRLNGQNFKGVVTKNVPGKHLSGKGSLMPIITDDIYFQFTTFTALTKSSDTLCFTFINRPGTNNNFPQYKKLYLGDTSEVLKYDVSQPIYNMSSYYRIKTVWEKTSGGRTSLVESYMTDYLSDITNNNSAAEGFYLNQNYPNPFNPSTNLEFGIANLGFVSLRVYDALGLEVRTLVNESRAAGFYSAEFDGSDLPSGVYFYRLEAGEFGETKRMILLK